MFCKNTVNTMHRTNTKAKNRGRKMDLLTRLKKRELEMETVAAMKSTSLVVEEVEAQKEKTKPTNKMLTAGGGTLHLHG